MKNLVRTHVSKRILFGGWLAALAFLASATQAQQPAARLTAEINDKERATIQGTHPLKARPEFDAGRMDPAAKLQGVTIVFARTAAQEADLQALIAAQQDPGSPSYHKWLTPEEFGARFGVADADLAQVQSWLEQRGFNVDSIARSKNSMSFSGTVAQIEATFGIEMHNYKIEGETHFAPSQDLSIPAVLAPLVQAVTNLSTFRPKSHLRRRDPRTTVNPNFTSSQTQSHFMGPGDVATIYDVTPAYKAGYNGAGQTIAVVGQSDIVMADIENFQKAAGFAIKDPVRVLVPNSGTATVRSGDEAESDLDLEYTSTIASGATIDFVYTGNSPNFNVFNAISYAITNNLAPIISVSYGLCESGLGGQAGYNAENSVFPQAATQGQSITVAAGDSGSTDCYGETGLTTAQQQALAVDFPASSQYVTAMGGTEFPAADTASTNTTYWQPASGTDVISSALSYIPETPWNDDAIANALSSGGGGASAFNPRPSWQTGVPGISGTMRLVPDISLASSPNYTGYLYCSSDTASTGVTGSCSNGFRDTNNKNLTVAGGTSFAAPIFAGMLAILNQNLKSTGQGVINSTLYTLAANSTTYGKAFHDITNGGNQCLVPGTKVCSTTGASEYPATTGYDEATGLGSIDFFNLLSAWPGSTTSLVASKTTPAAATSTPASGASDTITITVASGSSSTTTTPTGTLTIVVDGTTQTSSLALVNGSATFNFSSTAIGAHTISATYSGDTTYAASTGSVTVTVVSATLITSKTTEVAANTTPASGATDAITIAVASGSPSSTTTPTGTVAVSVDGTPASTLTLANGSATYNFSSTVTGSHAIAATYSGDTTYAASTTSITVTVAAPVQVASQTTVAAATSTPTFGASDTITITVASGSTSSTATPTGKVTVSVDGAQAPTLTLTNGSVTYNFSSTSVGAHTISAAYAGDTTYLSSSGSVGVTVPPVASNTAVAAATSTPASGASDAITITVTSSLAASTAVPTGTVTISVDGTAQTPALNLTNGAATYNFSSMTAGAHTVSAAYAGNTTYAGSNGSVSVTVSAPPKSFTVAATNVTVASGTSGTSTVTVTPQNGYTGTVTWTVTSSPALTNGCFSLPNTAVSGTAAVTATLMVATASTSCPLPARIGLGGSRHSILGPGTLYLENRPQPPANFPTYQTTWAMAGLVLIAALARRSRRLGLFAAACLLVAMGVGLSGCASGGSTGTGGSSTSVAKGTYTITIVGTDTATASETATTTVTVTVN